MSSDEKVWANQNVGEERIFLYVMRSYDENKKRDSEQCKFGVRTLVKNKLSVLNEEGWIAVGWV